ncbi:hypothetical protein [Nocardioides psychrotolerans]|uniref:hypothetical protein n=1 Tax=Nocardioides psychrotolerans TaxID=1005945 RepID=UPI003138267B
MKPLQSAAMGFIFVALYALFNGYDAYADPVGWVLVLLGVRRLPPATPLRFATLYVGCLALAVSVPLWFQAPREALADLDPSLAWAADLPAFACSALLCHGLAQAATAADDPRPARWLRTLRTVLVLVAVAPVLVFGAGLEQLARPATAAAQLGYLALIWFLFSSSGRIWAGAPIVESATPPPTPS